MFVVIIRTGSGWSVVCGGRGLLRLTSPPLVGIAAAGAGLVLGDVMISLEPVGRIPRMMIMMPATTLLLYLLLLMHLDMLLFLLLLLLCPWRVQRGVTAFIQLRASGALLPQLP